MYHLFHGQQTLNSLIASACNWEDGREVKGEVMGSLLCRSRGCLHSTQSGTRSKQRVISNKSQRTVLYISVIYASHLSTIIKKIGNIIQQNIKACAYLGLHQVPSISELTAHTAFLHWDLLQTLQSGGITNHPERKI